MSETHVVSLRYVAEQRPCLLGYIQTPYVPCHPMHVTSSRPLHKTHAVASPWLQRMNESVLLSSFLKRGTQVATRGRQAGTVVLAVVHRRERMGLESTHGRGTKTAWVLASSSIAPRREQEK